MSIRKYTLAIAAFMLSLQSLWFPANAGITIEECHRLAEENYPLIKKYQLVEKSSDYSVANLNRRYLPQLQLSAQASYQSDIAELPGALTTIMESYGYDYKGLKKDQYKLALDLNQIIWDGGETKTRKQAAEAGRNLQSAQVDVDIYAIRSRVDDLFFGILLIDENSRLNAELQNVLQSNCNKMEASLAGGVAMKADLDAVKAEYLKVLQQQDELEALKSGYKKVLALFIGSDESEIGNIEKPEAMLPNDLGNNRPELEFMDARIRQAKVDSRLIDAQTMPKLSLFAQAYYGYPSMDMFDDMFDRSMKLNGIAGVKFTWNIGSFYTKKNDKRKIALQIEDAENDRDVFLLNTQLQTIRQQADIKKFHDIMVRDDEIIGLRHSVRLAAEAKLENGVIDSNGLLQEISRENQAKIDKASHEIDLLKKIYELKNTINR